MEVKAQSGGGAGPFQKLRFGPFDLDVREGELRKEGRRIRLQEQPFQILQMLLTSPGEVVSREDIRRRLWPDNTIVEFDHSINAAIKRLRDTLRDSADKPRYIETVARRGYRFIGPIQAAADDPVMALPAATAPANEMVNAQSEPARRPRVSRPSMSVLLLAATLLVTWAGVEYSRRRARVSGAPLQPLMRLDLDLGGEVPPSNEAGANAILSPDGTRLVYVSRSRLVTRTLDQPNATELPGTENAQAPFFSPDGRWIAFFAGDKLKKISIAGGRVTELCNAPSGGESSGSWGEDGYIIVAAVNFALERIPAAGGVPVPLTELREGEIVHRWPQVLPGSKAVIFTSYGSWSGLDGANIEVMSLENRRRKTIVRGGTWGRFLPSGHLVYITNGTLFAVPFDPNRMEVRGTPAPVLEHVAYSALYGSAQIDFSRTGTLVYREAKAGGGLVTMHWVDQSGNTSPVLPVPGNYLSPALSADGNRLVFTLNGDIWVYELKRPSMVRLTFGGGYGNPVWSADGQYVVFRAARGIFWIKADATGHPEPLIESSSRILPWSFAPDGRLAFVELAPATGADIWTAPVERVGSRLRAGKPEVFLQTPAQERNPIFSPDGRWLAYMSNESGEYQVYVQAFPQKGHRRQVSAERGGYPAWSRKGNELFFWCLGRHSQLMVASYRAHGDSFIPDTPRVYTKKIVGIGTTRSYDPAPDGKRIVALIAADSAEASHDRVVFLLNFFDELRRRVP